MHLVPRDNISYIYILQQISEFSGNLNERSDVHSLSLTWIIFSETVIWVRVHIIFNVNIIACYKNIAQDLNFIKKILVCAIYITGCAVHAENNILFGLFLME